VRVAIDTDRCTGHGRCYSLAPDLFDCDDRGYGTVPDPDVPAGLEDQARTAVANCPEQAVSLEE
jgi:ferredoxin